MRILMMMLPLTPGRSEGEELCLWIRQIWFKSQILGKMHISEPWFLQIQMWNNNSTHFIRKPI